MGMHNLLYVISAAAEAGYEPTTATAGCWGRRGRSPSWLSWVIARHSSWPGTAHTNHRRWWPPSWSNPQLSFSSSSGPYDCWGEAAWTPPPHAWPLPGQGEGVGKTKCLARLALMPIRGQKCRLQHWVKLIDNIHWWSREGHYRHRETGKKVPMIDEVPT